MFFRGPGFGEVALINVFARYFREARRINQAGAFGVGIGVPSRSFRGLQIQNIEDCLSIESLFNRIN